MKRLEKVSLSQGHIDTKLNKNKNIIENILPEDYNWKKNFILAESAWLTAVLFTYGRVTTPDQYVSATIDLNQFLDFNLNHKFIPFINVELITKNPEGIESVGFFEYNREILEGDYVEVYGDSTNLIYKGQSFFYNGYLIKARLYRGDFQESFTKTHYVADVFFTRGGDEWRLKYFTTAANLVEFGIYYDTVVHHGVDFQTTVFSQCNSTSAPTNTDKIVEITSDSITLKGTLVTWVDTPTSDTFIVAYPGSWYSTSLIPSDGESSITSVTVNGGGCSWEFTGLNSVRVTSPTNIGDTIVVNYKYMAANSVPNQTITKNWVDIDDFAFEQYNGSILYKKVGGVWVSQSAESSFDSRYSDTVVTVHVFSFQGYWLYWDDNTIDLVSIVDASPVVDEGDFHKKILSNLPVDTDPPGDPVHRKWNTIKFLRNPEGHPSAQVEYPVEDAGNKEYIILKRFKSDNVNKNKYRLQLQGKLVFKLLADSTSSFLEYPIYAHTYVKNATTYYNPNSSFSLKNGTYYEPSVIPNIEYKIRVSLLNPWDFGTKGNFKG